MAKVIARFFKFELDINKVDFFFLWCALFACFIFLLRCAVCVHS